jgi:hypothetical protein
VVGDLVHGYVGFRVPVAPAGKVTHTIAVPVAPRFFRDILFKHALFQPWSVAVIDSDKVVIAATPEAPIIEGVPLPANLQLPDANFAKSGADYLAWAPVGQSGWTVLVIAPAVAVEKPFTEVRTALVIGGSLSAALTAVLVMILSSAWAARRETAELRLQLLVRRHIEVGRPVGEFLHVPDARRIYGDQQIVVGLKMKRARAGRTIDDVDHFGVFRVTHVERADHVRNPVTDIGISALHHDLDAVGPAAEVGVRHEADVLRGGRFHRMSPRTRATTTSST